jgi:hypothetical protein
VKIIYTPNLIVRELTADQWSRIHGADPRATIVEARGADACTRTLPRSGRVGRAGLPRGMSHQQAFVPPMLL